ncbi:MAG: serine hydrolase [Dyadobacter sp.]|uniref:serine hydrolase domain-containing protein n=1 Tax=Dyadobacter sp. TaxID=1914288 RepID=UPI001B0E2083|nr:serine hydrolase domain-containing protein [Dyadobacter sp.]MBO9613328.1 serine hydrolase [Dyadobacter sp.]
MKNKFLTFILFSNFLTNALYAQNDLLSRRIDSLMQAAHRIGVFNGNVIVVSKGQTIYQAAVGFADGSRQHPLTMQKRFDIGSIAKEFNGVSIMLLAEKRKLSVTDPIRKYLPELPPWADSIQISHLLNYTSGLPAGAANTDQDVLNQLLALKHLANTPGKAYQYAYSNVYLQQRIVENVSGLKYQTFVEKNILNPTGMKHTAMDLPLNDTTMAIAFNNKFVNEKPKETTTGWPRLPAEDLLRFMAAVDGYKLVGKASVQQLSQHFGEGESSLGEARFEQGELVWHQHHGSNFNYEALITHDLKNDRFVILTTSNQNFKVRQLATAILSILDNKPYTVPKRSLYLELREEMLADFDTGVAFYRTATEQKKDMYDLSFPIGDLVNTGKFLMRRNRIDDAIKVFTLGLLLDLQDKDYAIACQFIAEAYKQQGKNDMAALYAQQAVRKDPDNKIARSMLDRAGMAGKN